MRRYIVLSTLIAVGVLSLVASPYQQSSAAAGQQPDPKVIKVEKLKDNLFMLIGGGGNTAAFIGTNGVVVVDTKNPGWGQPILDQIKKLTTKPVTTLINTHTHGDHTSGNVDFPASVDVIVQENTKANMQKWVAYTGSEQPPVNVFKENNGKGLPKRTFADRMKLGSGADQIDLYYFGRGHTNGDAWIVFSALRVMHAGDIFAGKQIPFLDANNGGSGVAIADTLAKAHGTIKNVDMIITGHSTVMNMNDLAEYAQFNRDFLKAVQDGKRAGRTVDQVAGTWTIPSTYRGYVTPAAMALKRNIQVVYDELK